MENKERVLAYRTAKVIDSSDLSEVSGGSNWCHHETAKPSGANHSWDACIDVTIDF